jgi:hypothetical protein
VIWDRILSVPPKIYTNCSYVVLNNAGNAADTGTLVNTVGHAEYGRLPAHYQNNAVFCKRNQYKLAKVNL